MEWFLIGIFLLTGSISGLAAGFFGIGGGLIAIPIFLWVFESQNIGGTHVVQLTYGTNLFVIIFNSLLASYRHSINKQVLWPVVPFIALFSITGALIGSGLATWIPGKFLKLLFSLLLIYSSGRLILNLRPEVRLQPPPITGKKRRYFSILTGLIAGLTSGLTGLGGGVVTIPLLIGLLHLPVKMVAGTSSSIMIFTAFAATSGYILAGWNKPDLPPGTIGYVYMAAALPAVLGSSLFSQIGAQLNHLISPDKLRLVFAIFLILMSVKMLFF